MLWSLACVVHQVLAAAESASVGDHKGRLAIQRTRKAFEEQRANSAPLLRRRLAGGAGGRRVDGPKSGGCFICGQEGHWKNECPMQGDDLAEMLADERDAAMMYVNAITSATDAVLAMVTTGGKDIPNHARDGHAKMKTAIAATKEVWTKGQDPARLRTLVGKQEEAVAKDSNPWRTGLRYQKKGGGDEEKDKGNN